MTLIFAAGVLALNPFAHHVKLAPEELLPVAVKLNMVSEVDLPKGTEIVTTGESRPRYGDPKFWDVSIDHNSIFIRPKDDAPPIGGGRDTNVIVTTTEGRHLQMLAHEVSRDKNGKPDLRIVVELDGKEDAEPEYVRVEQLASLQTENGLLHRFCDPKPAPVSPVQPLRRSEVDTLNDLHFFDYEVYDKKGKRDFHTLLFHNDRWTFLAVSGLELPTVSARRDKKFVKVQATWVQNRYELPLLDEGMVEIGKDSFKFRLRSKTNETER